MIPTQNLRIVPAIQPVSLNDATATPVTVDTQGFSYVTFSLAVGVTTGAISAFKIQQSSHPTGSGDAFADVPGATLTELPGATDDGKRYAIHLNLRDRRIKRYLRVVLTEDDTGTGIYGVDAILGDPAVSPNTATDRGFTAEVIV